MADLSVAFAVGGALPQPTGLCLEGLRGDASQERAASMELNGVQTAESAHAMVVHQAKVIGA